MYGDAEPDCEAVFWRAFSSCNDNENKDRDKEEYERTFAFSCKVRWAWEYMFWWRATLCMLVACASVFKDVDRLG